MKLAVRNIKASRIKKKKKKKKDKTRKGFTFRCARMHIHIHVCIIRSVCQSIVSIAQKDEQD